MAAGELMAAHGLLVCVAVLGLVVHVAVQCLALGVAASDLVV